MIIINIIQTNKKLNNDKNNKKRRGGKEERRKEKRTVYSRVCLLVCVFLRFSERGGQKRPRE